MTPERWEQISRVFKSALERRGVERAEYLTAACAGDTELRREVEILLGSFDTEGAPVSNDGHAPAGEEPQLNVAEGAPPGLEGREVGRYIIREPLGAGGMGVVYRAEDRVLGRAVAIKFIEKGGDHVGNAARRFLREARAASQLNHPNIVVVHEIAETDEHSYLVMELVRGSSLREHIRRRSLSLPEALDIAAQTASALADAHAHSLIHRDIKPENILVDQRGTAKLADFGLARAFEATRPLSQEGAPTLAGVESLTGAGAVVGTLPYMSPEQLRKEPLDERTDVFSFGIVLHEMVAGRHPFAAASSFEIAAGILGRGRVETADLPAGLPEALRVLLVRLLEKDRVRRASSFVEIGRELNQIKRLVEGSASGAEGMMATQRFGAPVEAQNQTGRPTAPEVTSPTGRRTTPVSIVHDSSHHPAGASAQSLWTGAPRTVLVLPFEAVGTQEETSFIGVGLASVIMTALAKVGDISVLSKAAGAGRAIETGLGATELARELGANILLEGEVMRAGKNLRINARLSDVESGRVIWSDQYRGDESELFQIQDAVCESVASALKVSVSREARVEMAQPATNNIDAFELYSKGRAFLERRDQKGNVDLAAGMFYEALRMDQQFALAQAGLGECFWLKYEATREQLWVERAVAASDRALVLDPRQAQVRITLGIVYHGTGRLERAVEELERALELQPLSDDAHRWLGQCFMQLDQMERARSHFERAVELRPGYWDNYNWLGNFYYIAGDYTAAAEQFRRVIMFQPDSHLGYNNLGGIHCVLGRYDDAAAMHRRAIEIRPAATTYSNLGTDYFHLGLYEKALAAYRSAVEHEPGKDIYRRNLGDAFLRLGREEEARAEYERACALLAEGLAVKPNNARQLGRLAVCQAKLGRAAEARLSAERATALEPRNTHLMYQSAVVHALTGDEAGAADWLGRALKHGYSRTEVECDPDLDALRESAAYKSLLGQPPAGVS
ncbi:MAG TPA: tetratricopeptide repeat protein [Pyrinomonadaceae bacterium]